MAGKLAGTGRGRGRGAMAPNSEPNVIPFIDIMLVMLIIFMVAAPTPTVDVKVDLPPPGIPIYTQPEDKPTIVTLQDAGGVLVYYIGDELVTRETNGSHVSERLWGNIFRREKDEVEDRAYLSFLWSKRAYRVQTERRIEYSLLFGMLRWRAYPERPGVWPDLMLPAFPGPGWPAERGPTSTP